MRSSVPADIPLRCLILFHAAFCHLQPEFHHLQCFGIRAVFIQLFNQRSHIFFSERFDRDTPFLQPAFQLGYAVRIFQASQLIRLFRHDLGLHQITGDCLFHQWQVYLHAAIVYPLIQMVVIPFVIHKREAFQPLPDVPFRSNILQAVFFKLSPAFRVVFREIPRPAAIGFRRLAWNGEISNQCFTRRILLLTCLEHLSRCLQRQR